MDRSVVHSSADKGDLITVGAVVQFVTDKTDNSWRYCTVCNWYGW